MYNHQNSSAVSTGSGRRISSNNPFRSALLQEEAAASRSGSPRLDDAQYKRWLDQRIIEEENEKSRLYDDYLNDDNYSAYSSDDDANSFTEGDDSFGPPRPPHAQRTASEASKSSNNPFSTYIRKERSNNSASQVNTPTKQHYSRSGPNSVSGSVSKHGDAPPPAYHDVVAHTKYSRNEYPKDEKVPLRSEANPFPRRHYSSSSSEDEQDAPYNPAPRRAHTVSSSTNRAPPPVPPSSSKPNRTNSPAPRLNPDSMANTTTTRIMSDGRVRSKSTGDPISARLREDANGGHRGPHERHRERERERSSRDHKDKDSRASHERREHRDHRERREHRDPRERREHRSDRGGDDYERPRRSSKKNFVQQKSKNLDTIDRLDVTGFFGGGKFHHDGPFDACTPQRNKDNKAAPVAAFPIDGPNNSISGTGPNLSKGAQYDMVFGIDNAEAETETAAPSDKLSRNGYTNGTIVRRADSSEVESVVVSSKPALSQVNAASTDKLHGDTTLGLGSSTFMDGAPAYGSPSSSSSKEQSGLRRKKIILGRMKTIVRK